MPDNDTQSSVQTEGTPQAPSIPSAPSPEAGQQQTGSPTGQSGVIQAEKPVTPDWRSSPEFKGIAKENRRYKEQLTAMERKYAELEGKFSGFQSTAGQRTQPISPEDSQALERLVGLMLEHPGTYKMMQEKFGLGKIGELEKGFNDLSQSWYSSQADSERSEILADAKKLGLNPDEVSDELDRTLEEHPLYSQLNYKRGALKAVYRDLFFDRAGELRERALNQENISKRDALRKGQAQKPNSATGGKGAVSEDEKFQNVIREAGGMSGIDFTR